MDPNWKKPKFTSVARAVAARYLERPTLAMIRVWTIMDKLNRDYTKCGELDLLGYSYFPMVLLPGPAVITARGRRAGGFEDKQQRMLADRFTAALQSTTIPFLYGRNNWESAVWEIRIRSFLLQLDQGTCPQIIGRPQRRYNDHHTQKAYD